MHTENDYLLALLELADKSVFIKRVEITWSKFLIQFNVTLQILKDHKNFAVLDIS